MDLFFGAVCRSTIACRNTDDKSKNWSRLHVNSRWTLPALMCALFVLAHFSEIKPAVAVVLPNSTMHSNTTIHTNSTSNANTTSYMNETNPLAGAYKLFPFSKAYTSLMLGYYFANASMQNASTYDENPFPMRQIKSEESVCPKKVLLDVHNTSSGLKLSLYDPYNVCRASQYMTWPVKLMDIGNLLGPIFTSSYDLPEKPFIENERFMYTASGKDLWKCGDLLFSQISLYSLAQQFLNVMHAHLLSLAVPPSVLSHMLGKLNHQSSMGNSPLPAAWNSPYIEEAKMKLRETFGDLKHIPLMVLGHTEGASGTVSARNPDCFYVKDGEDDASFEEVSEHMSEVLSATIPIILKSVQMPIKTPALSLHMTDENCSIPPASAIESIEFPAVPPSHYARVAINGQICASADVSRLSDVEMIMKDDALGRKGLAVMQKLMPLMKNISDNKTFKSQAILGAWLALNAHAPDDFVHDLKTAILKSLTHVVRLDISKCPNIVDKKPVGLLLSIVPASKLFCKSVPGSDCTKLSFAKAAFLARDTPGETACSYSAFERNAVSAVPTAPKPENFPSVGSGNKNGVYNITNVPPPPYIPPPPQLPAPNTLPKLLWACFPANAMVNLRNGHRVPMKDVRVGDMVQVSPNTFSPVLLFTHALHDVRTLMTVIESASGKIVSSSTHYIHANGILMLAKDVKVGDFIVVKHEQELRHERVTEVTLKVMNGLYNPQTKSGDILVQYGDSAPVLASAYTAAVSPTLAHFFMAPLRWVHSQFGATFPGLSRFFPGTRIGQSGAIDGICEIITASAAAFNVWS